MNLPPEGGIAIVDKAPGMTSHDVVDRARRLLDIRKIGHAGTLDPDATGVLVLGIGRATRLLGFITGVDKSYVGEVVLGVETSTLDAAGEVTATHDMAAVTDDDVAAAAARFVGSIKQVPPMVSAVKVAGRRLHELAREGKEVEREARSVSVGRFDVEAVAGEPGVYGIAVDCSSGTYIRTLAADLGRALGGGAHLRALRRTAVGPYAIADARPVDELEVLPAGEAMPHLEPVEVDARLAAAVAHGKVLALSELAPGGPGPWRVMGPEGTMLAVYRLHHHDRAKPAVVLLHPAGEQ